MTGPYEKMPRGDLTNLVPALKKFFAAAGCMAINIVGNLFFGFNMYYCGDPEFLSYKTIWHRIAYFWCAMTIQRFMYYSPWCLSDAAMISCGLAYNGTDNGTHKWDRIYNISIYDLEIGSSSCISMMAYWNHTVHLWLKRHVQERAVQPGKKAGIRETLITFSISAMWHGLYPFYYIMFFFCALIVELSKEVFRSRALFASLPPTVRHILANQLTMLFLNYLGTSFSMLTFERGYIFGRATHFFGFIGIFLGVFLWKALGITKMAQAGQKKEKAVKQD